METVCGKDESGRFRRYDANCSVGSMYPDLVSLRLCPKMLVCIQVTKEEDYRGEGIHTLDQV